MRGSRNGGRPDFSRPSTPVICSESARASESPTHLVARLGELAVLVDDLACTRARDRALTEAIDLAMARADVADRVAASLGRRRMASGRERFEAFALESRLAELAEAVSASEDGARSDRSSR